MRADNLKSVIKYASIIPALFCLLGLVAIGQVYIPKYVYYGRKFGFRLFTTRFLHEIRHFKFEKLSPPKLSKGETL